MSDAERRATEQIEEYKKLGEQNKGVDTPALMMNALAVAQREEMDQSKKKRAYWISIVVPPIGLFIAAYYWLKGGPSSKSVAINCVILTAISLFLAWGAAKLLFASVPAGTTDQLQNLNVADIKGLLAP